ncbi:2-isopropylmalate synthase [Candidatus Poribacteria bacterium]|nr:2-isopropylmalate synthase [Candidatus Poribacteria bacterium]
MGRITRTTPEDTLRMATDAVSYAKSLCEGHPDANVEFSPMDAGRTELAFLYEVVEATIAAGATVVNIPETVGWTVPTEFGDLIKGIMENVPNVNDAIISVHCHNDLGLAVANSLIAAINGLGERAGNTSLEEVVMAIRTRRDYFKAYYTDINAKEIVPISRRVSRTMGIAVQPNKAIVGANAFAHSSGIHQDGIIKSRVTFEIIDPKEIGWKESQLVLSPRSGRNALRHRLSELGYEVDAEQLDKVYERFLRVADKKKAVQDADLEATAVFELDYIQVVSGTRISPTTTVGVRTEDGVVERASTGDGPVDAAFKAISQIVDIQLNLIDYQIRSVTEGEDAIGEVSLKVQDNGNIITGHGASTDIIEASARAYIHAVNKLIQIRSEG